MYHKAAIPMNKADPTLYHTSKSESFC